MGMRRDGSGIKRERIRRMHQMLRGAGDVPLSRFLATCSYQLGLTRQTARRYLQDLEDLDFVEVDEVSNIVREVKPEE